MNRELRAKLFREFLKRTRAGARFIGIAVLALVSAALPILLFAGIAALGVPWGFGLPVFLLYVPIGAAWTVWLDYNDRILR